MRRVYFLFIFIFSAAFSSGQTDNIPDRPSPQRMVNNLSKQFPQFISASEQDQLESKLVAFNDSTSNQIAVVIVDDLGGLDVNGFATQLFNKWGIGRAKNDNGVLLLIKPTGTGTEKKIYISTGHGLDAVIPDLAAKRIVDEEITPEFKNGNYAQGINKGVDKIMGLAVGQFDSKEYANNGGGNSWRELKYVFIGILIIFFIIRNFRGGGGMTMSRTGIGFLGGSFFGGGGFGGGGGGGGGFGGFGGGSSGGGGAGGSW